MMDLSSALLLVPWVHLCCCCCLPVVSGDDGLEAGLEVPDAAQDLALLQLVDIPKTHGALCSY